MGNGSTNPGPTNHLGHVETSKASSLFGTAYRNQVAKIYLSPCQGNHRHYALARLRHPYPAPPFRKHGIIRLPCKCQRSAKWISPIHVQRMNLTNHIKGSHAGSAPRLLPQNPTDHLRISGPRSLASRICCTARGPMCPSLPRRGTP